ncbi:hypothetical protein C6503_27180 [Candidatus Poribacteria bacterium]|nr:MAG: hypothetical protein C6503_27180 [Candidatus Poribacteria bacterium]
MQRNWLISIVLAVLTFGLSISLQSSSADQINLQNILDKNTILQVQAYWDPIADASLGLPDYTPKHAALFKNLSPAHPNREYAADAFKTFFPNKPVAVGSVWELDTNKIIPFLRQFHSGATAEMHINPGAWRNTAHGREVISGMESDGAFACLRALSAGYAEIAFRIHAEFVLDKAARAYFTPAQFAGRLILNRKDGTIREFCLYLPPRNTNVDINALGGADMVYVPRMELIGQNIDDQSDIVWETSMTEADAKSALEAAFYKFSEIERLPVEEAVAYAQEKNRPIHLLLTWGVFDDESC